MSMRSEEQLLQLGLKPANESLLLVRQTLVAQIELERHAEEGNHHVIMLCCVQLFGGAFLDDVLLIWEAKSSGFDLFCSLDVQLLCGAGLDETKEFLSAHPSETAKAALTYIEECELTGDFNSWSPSKQMEYYRSYFGQA